MMRQVIRIFLACVLLTCGVSRGFHMMQAAAQERRIPRPDDDDSRSAQSVSPGKKGAAAAGTVTGAFGMLELQRCAHDGKKITCRFTFTPARQLPAVYQSRALFRGNALVDNMQRQHPLVQSWFLDRGEKPMPTANLSSGESVTFIQEFGGASAELLTVRLYAPGTRGEIRDVKVEVQ